MHSLVGTRLISSSAQIALLAPCRAGSLSRCKSGCKTCGEALKDVPDAQRLQVRGGRGCAACAQAIQGWVAVLPP